MLWKTILKTYQDAPWVLWGLVFPFAIASVFLPLVHGSFIFNELGIAAFIYMSYYLLGFPLLVRPYLKRTTGETDRDKELPYLLIPFVVISFFLLVYDVGSYYFAHGVFPAWNWFSHSLSGFLLSIAAWVYYGVIVPKVFHFSFHERSVVKPLTAARTFAFILPSIFGAMSFIWMITGFVVSLFIPALDGDPPEMKISLTWWSIPIYLAVLGLLNRVWLRPYLLRTKGRVSRDDQLPYFVIPTSFAVFSVFLFDTHQYSIEAIPTEQLRFSFTLFICSATILLYVGYIFPRFYCFNFQELTFPKTLSRDALAATLTFTFFLLFFLFSFLMVYFGR